jgi:hypothetical protein
MTVFYRGPCALITHKVFETRCPVYQSFDLCDLYLVQVVERTAQPPATVSSARVGSTGVAGATAVALALGWTEGWPTFDQPVVGLATLALLVVSVAVSGACWRVRPVQLELAAIYHDRPVSLFQTTNELTFGQVKRALLRALESLGDMA